MATSSNSSATATASASKPAKETQPVQAPPAHMMDMNAYVPDNSLTIAIARNLAGLPNVQQPAGMYNPSKSVGSSGAVSK